MFYKGKGYKNGYRSSCKECIKKYREINKNKKKEYLRKYKEEKKDILKLKNKKYREKNKNKIEKWKGNNKTYFIEYREKNKDKIKKYYEKNKEKIIKQTTIYQRKKVKENEIYRFQRNVRSIVLGAFKRGTNQFRKESRTEEILGCTIEEFRNYIFTKFKEGMTFKNHGKWHLDHIIPLATAKTQEDIIRLNHYTNFQPLWSKDNLIKGKKLTDTYL